MFVAVRLHADDAALVQRRAMLRDEGKEYVVQDGDLMLFKFNT